MTGQDIQDRLDGIVADLQTKGKGQTVNVMFRNSGNTPNILPLSSTPAGVVNAAQLAAIQTIVDDMKAYADDYEAARVPVSAAIDAFTTAQAPHQALIDAASNARSTLNDALDADANYQTAKTNLETARANPLYISATNDYKTQNVSENYSELQSAKGKYV